LNRYGSRVCGARRGHLVSNDTKFDTNRGAWANSI